MVNVTKFFGHFMFTMTLKVPKAKLSIGLLYISHLYLLILFYFDIFEVFFILCEQKIKERLEKYRPRSVTIDVIVTEDKRNKMELNSESTTQSLLWLTRYAYAVLYKTRAKTPQKHRQLNNTHDNLTRMTTV